MSRVTYGNVYIYGVCVRLSLQTAFQVEWWLELTIIINLPDNQL